MYAPHKTHAQTYRQVELHSRVDTAHPHQLVTLLFDGVVESIDTARGAMQRGDVLAKCNAIGRAVRIVDEGLKSSLNLSAGGGLATDLHELYGYLVLRLTQANARNDLKALEEARSLVEPLRSAWVAIGSQVGAQVGAQAHAQRLARAA